MHFICHGKATIVVHISNHNYSTPVVYTHSPTRFPTVLLPLSTSLSPFPQPPFEAVPSTKGGRGGGQEERGGQDERGGQGEGGSGWGGERRHWKWGGRVLGLGGLAGDPDEMTW